MPSDEAEKTTARQVKRPGVATNPCCRLDGAHFVSGTAIFGVAQRCDVHDPRFGEDLRSVLFGQIQIAQVESIFRAVTATHHAATAADACGSCRAFSSEVRVGEGLIAQLSLLRLEDANFCAVESMTSARSFRSFLQEMVGGTEDSVFRHSQHARCGFVVLGHFGFPVGQSRP